MATRNGTSGDDVLDAAAFGELAEINIYRGAGGDDTLTGGALTDTLIGGEGSDRLFGGDGADSLSDRGEVGDDSLDGGAGDDVLEGRYGSDTLIGGAGHDTITFGFGSMLVSGGAGDDTFISIGQDPASATITGGQGDDVLYAGASADSFDGGQGEDLVDYSATRTGVVVNFQTGQTGGGAAGDTFRFVEDVVGTAHADVIVGDGAYNVFLGGAGDDTLGGGFGGDYLDGGDGFDVADLGAGGSTAVVANLAAMTFAGGGADGDTLLNFEGLAGSDLADALRGDAGANLLIGRAGADTLTGAEGADTMLGGLGFDLYRVDDLLDSFVENSSGGVDTVEATIDYSLAGILNVENLTLVGPSALSGSGNSLKNVITGSEFDNVLDGAGGADTMNGGDGNDTFHVDSRNDRIFDSSDTGDFDQVLSTVELRLSGALIERTTLLGTDDLDVLILPSFQGEVVGNSGDNRFTYDGDRFPPNAGHVTITGGSGSDSIYFRDRTNCTISDFSVEEDLIELRGSIFKLSVGALNPSQFEIGSHPSGSAVRILYESDTGYLFYDLDGSGGQATRLLARLDSGLDLSADDFFVV